MLTISPDFLRLTDEAVLLLRRGKIIFANEAAAAILGADCIDRPASAFLGSDITASQATSFSAMSSVKGKNYIFRSSASGDVQALFFSSPYNSCVMLTDTVLCSLRSFMMTMNISLAAAREAAEALGDSGLDSSLAAICEQGYMISRLVGNASSAKCIFEDSIPFIPEPHDIAQLCSDIADSVSILRKDVDVTYSGPEHLVINCDETLTESMLLNLISNALTHADGVTRIRISLTVSGQMVHFGVSDNGRGMDEDALSTVFSRFKREISLSDIGRGAGFGMTVVRGAAQAHGGTLMLESTPARGTIVRVSYSMALAGSGNVAAPENKARGMEPILTGLAGCLPAECYTGRFLD